MTTFAYRSLLLLFYVDNNIIFLVKTVIHVHVAIKQTEKNCAHRNILQFMVAKNCRLRVNILEKYREKI
jgi:hypothetical protein